MNRDDLDGWFARADDVLTDWHGSDDAMNTAEPEPPKVFVDIGWLVVPWADPESAVVVDLRAALRRMGAAFRAGLIENVRRESNWPPPEADLLDPEIGTEAPFARALEARRNRNTGPPDRRRLDGRRTRR